MTQYTVTIYRNAGNAGNPQWEPWHTFPDISGPIELTDIAAEWLAEQISAAFEMLEKYKKKDQR